MFPANFDYQRASSAQEALQMLQANPGSKLIAGGHSLLPMMKLRLAMPESLVDIGRIASLRGIRRDGDTLGVGALTRHADLAASSELKEHCPILAEAAAKIADPQVRNRGTVGGNVAHADPASDLPAVLVALDATLELLSSGGQRQVRAQDFFTGLLMTDLREDELITAVHVPVLGPGTGSAYLKVEHPASGYAVCGAAAVVTIGDDGRCTKAVLAFNGIADTPVHADAVATTLVGGPLEDSAIDEAVNSLLSVADPLGDAQASGEYRVHLAKVHGRRALKLARDRAKG